MPPPLPLTTTPVLTTLRLRLVPFAEEHLSVRYLGWLRDPEVMRYSENRHRPPMLEDCRQFWQGLRAGGHHGWALLRCDGGESHIGNLVAYLDPPNRVADLSIMIGAHDARGQGLALESWNAVCGWLLGPAGFRKIAAGTMAANRAMLRLMQASGMSEDGRRRRHFLLEGEAVDLVYACRFADEALPARHDLL